MGPNRRTAENCAFWLRIALSGLPELIEFLRICRDHALADAPRPPGGAIIKSDDDWRASYGTRRRACLQGLGSRRRRPPCDRRLPARDGCADRAAPPVAD